MTARNIVFDNFSGGEYGRFNAWNAPPHSWTGQNMLVYKTGELGVRPGLKNISPSSGLVNGVLRSFGATPAVGQPFFCIISNKVYTWNGASTAATASSATIAGTPTDVYDWFIDSGLLYMTAPGITNSISVNIQTGAGVAPVVAALTGSPSGSCIVQYGDRTVIGNITGSGANRIRYSDAANKNSWPSANFIDVGDSWSVNALLNQRQHLLIGKQEQQHVLTGVPGFNNVLRMVNTGQAAFRPMAIAPGDRDVVYGWPINENYPYAFNGTTQSDFDHLTDWMDYGGASPVGVFPPTEIGVAPIVGKNKGAAFFQQTSSHGLLLVNGIWSKHVYGVTTCGLTNSRWASGHHAVYTTDGGGASATANFYALNTEAISPGIEGGTLMRAGDDSSTALTGQFDMPEWWDSGASDVYVKAVIVDFRKWNTGSATHNHFDLSVDALRRYQVGAAQASNTVSWDEAASTASATGTLERQMFGFGEQGMGNGFQLHFTNVRGIAIQRIEIVLDVNTVRN